MFTLCALFYALFWGYFYISVIYQSHISHTSVLYHSPNSVIYQSYTGPDGYLLPYLTRILFLLPVPYPPLSSKGKWSFNRFWETIKSSHIPQIPKPCPINASDELTEIQNTKLGKGEREKSGEHHDDNHTTDMQGTTRWYLDASNQGHQYKGHFMANFKHICSNAVDTLRRQGEKRRAGA